jgi:signal transduction histidine kinase
MMQLSVKAAHKMSNIIDELLLLASVRREQVTLEPLAMETVVAQAWLRLSHLHEKYRPALVVPDHWPTAVGYAPWVEEVWANYLSNGLKYGGRPPRLVLGATPEAGGQWRFWVQDNGPGLSAAAQAQLFTEFTRLDKIRAQGHGLGLSIVRRIMAKLGGAAGVESTPGHGSTFYFTLPSGEAHE